MISTNKSLKQKIGAFIIPILPITRENFNRLRFELHTFLINTNNSINPFALYKIYTLKRRTNISINVGAGPFGKENWINIDTHKFKNISLVYDCRRKLPFRESSVSRIRCEHVFEHLDKVDEAPTFLKNCLRCLAPGGILRIVVPDLELFITAYNSKDPKEWQKIGFDLTNLPWGLETPMDILNHTFRQNGEHKYGYDFFTLQKLVLKAGFSQVNKMEWGKSNDNLLEDDLENHKPYSLYVDCIK
jgi:predicted SAM-dependent methyltransferase